MAVARLKIFAVEILTASDLNAEFSNITDNGEDLAWPASKAKDFNGNALTLDADGDSQLVVSTDDRLDVLLAGTTLFRLDGTVATPVNGIDFIARATGSPASIQAQGSDANVGLDIRDDNGNELLVLSAVASAVNDLTITNAATGVAPSLGSSGEIDTGLQLQDSNGNEVLILSAVASAVNELTVTNAATGNAPILQSSGEANTGLQIQDSNDNEILIGAAVASAVNEITVTNAATGNNPSIAATGDNTDISVDVIPKGTGSLLERGAKVGVSKAIAGLVPAIGTDTEHDIDISAGTARDSTNVVYLTLAASLTKQIDAAWAVGTDQGGMDAGTVTLDETYHLHLIQRSDTGVVDALFSLSPTAPTMPADYDRRRRIASLTTDGSDNIIGFTAFETDGGGLHTLLDVPVNDQDANNPGTSAVTVALSVPTDIKLRPISNIGILRTANTQAYGLASSLDTTDTAPSATLYNYAGRGDGTNPQGIGPNILDFLYTNTSGEIRTRLNSSGADLDQRITTLGWIDSRRRDN